MFVQTFGPGLSLGAPDICKTPPLAIPAPFPNTAMNAMAIPSYFTVMINCMPELTVVAMHPITMGDEAGTLGGVVSQIILGPCMCTLPSMVCFVGGMPVWRLTAITLHNLANCPGVTTVPSQPILQVMR